MFSSTQILIGILGLALAAGVGCSDSDDADGAGGSGAVGGAGGAAGAGGSGAVGGAAGAGGSGAVGGAGGAAGSGCEVGAGGAAGAGGATGAAGATGAGGATGTAITQDIPAACLDELTGALADFPINVTIETSAISANMPFTADITARITVTEAFIEAALAFSPTLTTARVSLALATVAVVANATGPEVQTSLSPPQTFDLIADTNWNCIPGPLVIPLSTETGSYTAGASGTNIEFDLVGFLEVGSPTQFPLFLFGTFPIHIDCVPGTVNDNGTPDDDADDFVNPQDPAARISFAIP